MATRIDAPEGVLSGEHLHDLPYGHTTSRTFSTVSRSYLGDMKSLNLNEVSRK
eukprot:UN25586